MLRMTLMAGAAIGGLALAVVYPSIPDTARSLLGMQSTPAGTARAAASAAAPKGDGHGHAEGEGHGEEGHIAMTAEGIEAAGIRVAPVGGGTLVSRAAVPGVLAASQDRQARVTARLGGIVAEVRKTLGEEVARGDVLAVLESREVADAKGEFLAATRSAALAETTLARETRLWRQRISAEQEFLQARTAAEEARIKVDC